jgi:signal transduction histidine kinase/CheY-like chemotaxis protein
METDRASQRTAASPPSPPSPAAPAAIARQRAGGTLFRTSVFRAAASVALAGLVALAATMLATLALDSRARVEAEATLFAGLLAASAERNPVPDAMRVPHVPATFDAHVCVYDTRGARMPPAQRGCAESLALALAADAWLTPVGTATLPAAPADRGATPGARTVVVTLPDGQVPAALSRHLLSFLIAGVLLAGVCMLVGARYVRRQGAEIERVRDAANAMRAGSGPVTVVRPRTTEFAELLDAITETTTAVRDRISDAEREIAERQRAEAALVASEHRIRRMIDAVPQAVFAVTREGQLLLVNQQLAKLYDRTPAELLDDPSPLFADPWLTVPQNVVIGHGDASRVLEVHRVPFPLAGPLEDTPEHTADGTAPGTLVVGNDVTEARHLQMQLNQASRMQAIGQLAGGIAHEFNNLLTPINGHAELLRARLHDPELQRPLDAITGAATRARQLIRQVLSFSRTTEQLFERTPTAIGAVIEEVALLMRGSLPSSIEFRVQIERGLPPVLADAGQLHQVLVNLCTNAAQAIDGMNATRVQASEVELGDGGQLIRGRIGGRIDVIADAIHAEDLPPAFHGDFGARQVSGVRVRVLDNGAGMAPDVMSRVFDPFFSTKPGDQGTGLGLAVAKGIVEAHGGQIRVDASPGWATCFEILLPGVHAEPVADDAGAVNGAPPGTLRARHVLIVDDDLAVLLVTGEMLRALGYEVSTAPSGERALELLRDPAVPPVDLVITDNSMPGMDGHTLARRLRAMLPRLPIVMLTGLMESSDDATSAINLQLMKPIGMAELERSLSGLLATTDTP